MEIYKLLEVLIESRIPFQAQGILGGFQICYPSSENTICSCICHKYSYGNESGLIEINGLLTEEEKAVDFVLGYLTADEVFERIKKHYERNGEQYD